MQDKRKEIKLAAKDHALTALQAGLLAIPVYGASLEKLLFGGAAEVRMRRVEETLAEVCEKLVEQGKAANIEGNEEFANLMEEVLPPLGKATIESKRARFRDLLFNAMQLPPNDKSWEAASLAASTLANLNGTAMEILAGIHLVSQSDQPYQYRSRPCVINMGGLRHRKKLGYYLALQQESQSFSLDAPECPKSTFFDLSESEPVIIRETLNKMTSLGILKFKAERNFLHHGIVLTDLGQLLIRWAISDAFEQKKPTEQQAV